MFDRNSSLIFAGISLIIIGLMSFASIWTNLNLFSLFCPAMLILIGIWMLIKPRHVSFIGDAHVVFIGEIERSGQWSVKGESFLAFISDIDLDLTQADLPAGETNYSFTGFISDATLRVPADVGVRVSAAGFVNEVKLPGHKEESFIVPLAWQSENYASAERKIHLDATGFVNEIKVRQI